MTGHIDSTGILALILLVLASFTFYVNRQLAVAVVAAIAVVGFALALMGGAK